MAVPVMTALCVSFLSQGVWGTLKSLSFLRPSKDDLRGHSGRASPGGIQLPCPTSRVSFQKPPREKSRIRDFGHTGEDIAWERIYQAGSQEKTEGWLMEV